MERKTLWKIAGVLVGVVLVLVVLISMIPESEATRDKRMAKEAEAAAEDAEDRRKGFHCLTVRGRHRDMERFIKERLKDPGSYEYISTSIAPVDEGAEHVIFVNYRARNSFGGMVIGQAGGFVDPETCEARFGDFMNK